MADYNNWRVHAVPRIVFEKPYVPSEEQLLQIRDNYRKSSDWYCLKTGVANFFRIGFGLSPLEE